MDNFNRYLEFQKDLAEMTLKIVAKYQKNGDDNSRFSQLALVVEILQKAGEPLHINEILRIAQCDYNVILNRDSITSAIAKKIKADSTFIKTSPNTFYIKSDINETTI